MAGGAIGLEAIVVADMILPVVPGRTLDADIVGADVIVVGATVVAGRTLGAPTVAVGGDAAITMPVV